MSDTRYIRAPTASQEGEEVVLSEHPEPKTSTKPLNFEPLSNNTLRMNTLLRADSTVLNAGSSNMGSEMDEMELANPADTGNTLKTFPPDPSSFGPRPTNMNSSAVNLYQQKKTVAQGMMDLALLSANANQLRYVIDSGGNHPYYYPNIVLIGISIILQVGVGVGLILNSQCNVSYEDSMRKAIRINNYTVLAIFIITALNVIISAFGIADVNTLAPTTP